MFNQPDQPDDSYTHDERRQYRRFKRGFALYIDAEGRKHTATTENVGVGGLYLHTKTLLAEGTNLTLHIPRGINDVIIVQAQVVHSNPGHGAGVRFQFSSPQTRNELEEYVRNL